MHLYNAYISIMTNVIRNLQREWEILHETRFILKLEDKSLILWHFIRGRVNSEGLIKSYLSSSEDHTYAKKKTTGNS